jgi:hypothetical protein
VLATLRVDIPPIDVRYSEMIGGADPHINVSRASTQLSP